MDGNRPLTSSFLSISMAVFRFLPILPLLLSWFIMLSAPGAQAQNQPELARMQQRETAPAQTSEHFESTTIGQETWRRLMATITSERQSGAKAKQLQHAPQIVEKREVSPKTKKRNATHKYPSTAVTHQPDAVALAQGKPCHQHVQPVATPASRPAPWQIRAWRYGPRTR